jgi:hypothetical protein
MDIPAAGVDVVLCREFAPIGHVRLTTKDDDVLPSFLHLWKENKK